MSILLDEERIAEQLADVRDAIADENSHDLSDLSDLDLENVIENWIQIKVDYFIEELLHHATHDRREFLEEIDRLRRGRARAKRRAA